MGKNFPQVTNLKEKPLLFEKTIQLIEESFKYQAPHSFKNDFAPLIDGKNHENCFILIDENENVLAHIGVKEKFITLFETKFSFTMLGGIAVDEKHRGLGHFHTLMSDVLAEKRSDTALFLLWSDQEKLYSKFGFFLCGDQFEFPHLSNAKKDFVQTKLSSLNDGEKKELYEIYETSFQKNYVSFDRSIDDWKTIERISGADLFIKKDNNQITDYFFMNKGQDLNGVVYEYGSLTSWEDVITSAQAYGKVWSALPVQETENHQYQYTLCPSDKKQLIQFIYAYTQGMIKIRDINHIKNEVYFDFNEETLSLELQDFFRGIFGPGAFEELENWKPIYISGLDSI